ncbi:hypothetical protein NQ017_04170 [Corynebacterium sp. 732RC1]|uniref:hypothetical protein n=1 Tax=Corynebacterium TaxID=1716 RepID=UPI00211BF7BE|nr:MULTISPECIES: hypothetical protein [unclassified Corynebacterium]MCQ9343101.1 hypothetical protein [Corynebacterium sp. 76QC2CO]MCQ9352116.1 hypothetical protein [Corynebacterium sp. 209RC1]MCQ9354118.1 hypothetical protein [Corynebacterium sp. 1222RC1]MCQ9356398.1 hypothetical protein [Corynebacterium sp. 122RC1]MCQ9358500.1 hypothetical protein [Corynebacterium sp. 142RC1]
MDLPPSVPEHTAQALEPIPGRAMLKVLNPERLHSPSPPPAPYQELPQEVQRKVRHLIEVALAASFGLIDVRRLSPSLFAPPVLRSIRARRRGTAQGGAITKMSMHLRVRSQRIDALGSATIAGQDIHLGYAAMVAADEESTLGLQLRSFRVL